MGKAVASKSVCLICSAGSGGECLAPTCAGSWERSHTTIPFPPSPRDKHKYLRPGSSAQDFQVGKATKRRKLHEDSPGHRSHMKACVGHSRGPGANSQDTLAATRPCGTCPRSASHTLFFWLWFLQDSVVSLPGFFPLSNQHKETCTHAEWRMYKVIH